MMNPTTPAVCFHCGLTDAAKVPLYPLSVYRHWRDGGRAGRMRGRSIGPIRLCRLCVLELLRRKQTRPASTARLTIDAAGIPHPA